MISIRDDALRASTSGYYHAGDKISFTTVRMADYRSRYTEDGVHAFFSNKTFDGLE